MCVDGFRSRETVVIVGGGVMGLSIALELVQRPAAPQVIVLSRRRNESAAMAAGGMLAPQGERLPGGPLLDLCLLSRERYSAYVRRVEQAAGGVCTGYDPCGLMAPAFRDDPVHHWKPPANAGEAYFLSAAETRMLEPALTEAADFVGAWYFPEDAQVDNQALMDALTLACRNRGVWFMENQEAVAITPTRQGRRQRVEAVRLASGTLLYADQFILASGAWARQLVSVPVRPQKGQMLSVSAPSGTAGMDSMIRRVLYGAELYVAPKRLAGRIVIGSTVEDVGFDDRCTVSGIGGLLHRLERLCPALSNWTLDRTWSGFRPLTPDLLPILGPSTEYSNMYYALGHWRNGILLAPLISEMVADDVLGSTPAIDPSLVRACRFERFMHDSAGGVQLKISTSTRTPAPGNERLPSQSHSPEVAAPNASTDVVPKEIQVGDEPQQRSSAGSRDETESVAAPRLGDIQDGLRQDDSDIKMWKLADDGSFIPIEPGSGIPEPPDAAQSSLEGSAAVQWPWAVLDSLEEQRRREILEQTRTFRAQNSRENGATDTTPGRDHSPMKRPVSETSATAAEAGTGRSLNAYDDIRVPPQNGTMREASKTTSASATATAAPSAAASAPSLDDQVNRMREGIAAALREYEKDWDLDAFDRQAPEQARAPSEEPTLEKPKPQGADAVRQSMFDAFAQIRAFMEKPTNLDDDTGSPQR